MTLGSRNVKVTLANGATMHVEAAVIGGEQEVSFEQLSFKGVSEAIEGISQSVMQALKKVAPSKVSVELALEVGIDEGALTALLVKVDSKANLKIKLEWGTQSRAAADDDEG
jgi:Trypsin-co-occurring domain 1